MRFYLKSMMKRNGKWLWRSWLHLRNMLRNDQCLRWKKFKRCYSGWKWNLTNTNGQRQLVWRGFSTFNWPFQKKTCWRNFCELGKTKDNWVRTQVWWKIDCHWPGTHTWTTWYFFWMHYKKSQFFKRFNLIKVSTLTKRMSTLIKGMGHERHIILFGWFFWLKWPFWQSLLSYI